MKTDKRIEDLTHKEKTIYGWLGWLNKRVVPFYEIWQGCALNGVYEDAFKAGVEFGEQLAREKAVKAVEEEIKKMGTVIP